MLRDPEERVERRGSRYVTGVALALLTLVVLVLAGPQPLSVAKPAQAAAPAEVNFPGGGMQLRGFIWRPTGAGPFPALLWNHGSEKLPGWLPGLAPVFVRQGYVFFIPHRRGQGRSPGPYIQDQIEQAGSRAERSRLLVELHELQLNDQIAALAFLKNQSYVDSGRLAVAGCSYGGIQTVLAAERETGYRAAIDFAGGAESWQASPDLQRRMIRAVHSATVPIFFIQAENDHDLAPSRVLAAEMQRVGKPHQLRIYPRFGSTADEAHAFCVRGADVWAADVVSYLNANLK